MVEVWYEIITLGTFGWAAQLIPIILVLGISFYISKKTRDMIFWMFPVSVGIKIIFPFFDVAWIIMFFALFIMNIMGSNQDVLAEVKSIPAKLRDVGMSLRKEDRAGKEKERRFKERFEEFKREQLRIK